jgi:PAS domain S-box-containing protein
MWQPAVVDELTPNFRALVENSPDMIIRFDQDLRFTYVNPASERLLGIAPALLLGRSVAAVEIEPLPTLWAEYGQYLPQVLATGQAATLRVALPTLLGERAFDVCLMPEFDSVGQVIGLFATWRDITVHWQTEQQFRAAEARNRALLAAFPDTILPIQCDGTYWEVKLPLGPAESLAESQLCPGQKIQDLLPPEVARPIGARHQQALATGEMQVFETSMMGPQGIIYGESRVVPLHAEEVLVAIRDITSQKVAELALQRSEETVRAQMAELEAIYATAPIGLCVLDNGLRHVRVNEMFAAMNGLPVADHLGRTPRELLPTAIVDQFEPSMRNVLTTGQAVESLEVSGRMASDPTTQHTWAVSYYPVRTAAGEIRGVNVVMADITQRRAVEAVRQQLNTTLEALVAVRTAELQAANTALHVRIAEHEESEIALRRSEERYRTLLEMMPDALFVHQENRIIYGNPAFLRLLGASSLEQVLGKPPLDFYHPGSHPQVRARGKHLLAYGGVLPLVNLQIVRLDGVLVDVESAASLYQNQEGKGIQVILRDITERQQAAAQREHLLAQLAAHHQHLQQLNHQLATAQENTYKLLARELHDQVGQTLTALGISLALLQEQLARNLLDPTQAAQALDDPRAQVAQISQTVRELLSELRPPTLDELGLLSTLRWYAEILTRRTQLPIRIGGTEPTPKLTEPVVLALFRITQEALTNVIKHAQATQVEVQLWAEDARVFLTIEDNGCGFDVPQFIVSGQSGHWGILGMQERAEAVAGELVIESYAGQGTIVQVTVLQIGV